MRPRRALPLARLNDTRVTSCLHRLKGCHEHEETALNLASLLEAPVDAENKMRSTYDERFFAPKSRNQWRNLYYVKQLAFAVLVWLTFGLQGDAA